MAGAGLHQEPYIPYIPKGRAGCSGAHPPGSHGQPDPQSRGQPSLMATTGILLFEHPLENAGAQESCPGRHSPVLHLLTLSLLPVGTPQLTQGLSPPQDNDHSPERKDTSASVGKAFGLCQDTPVEPRRGKLILYTSIAGCQGTDQH